MTYKVTSEGEVKTPTSRLRTGGCRDVRRRGDLVRWIKFNVGEVGRKN